MMMLSPSLRTPPVLLRASAWNNNNNNNNNNNVSNKHHSSAVAACNGLASRGDLAEHLLLLFGPPGACWGAGGGAVGTKRSWSGIGASRRRGVLRLEKQPQQQHSWSFLNSSSSFSSSKHPQCLASSAQGEIDMSKAAKFIPAAPILIPAGDWKEVEGGVTAARGFKAAGMYGALRAQGNKPDLALVMCESPAVSAGMFTTNLMAAAPVLFCKKQLENSETASAVLINAGQANAATGSAGYEDTIECAAAVAKVLGIPASAVLIESTGVIGRRIKKAELLASLPSLAATLSTSVDAAGAAAVAITTTDLVSKSAALEIKLSSGQRVRVGGMAKGSGMIHPNMATMLGVVTCDADVEVSVWRAMVATAVRRSFNQITVDGDTSTNDTVIALASGMAATTTQDGQGGSRIASADTADAHKLQAALDALCQGLAKSIAWDGEGATCLIEVQVSGAESEAAAATVARSVAGSSLVKAAVYGRDPNWGRIACAAGYSGVSFDPQALNIFLGDFHLMKDGQPLAFDRAAASAYLKSTGDVHGSVILSLSIGAGVGSSKAWGCDLSYDYVKINAEYTT